MKLITTVLTVLSIASYANADTLLVMPPALATLYGSLGIKTVNTIEGSAIAAKPAVPATSTAAEIPAEPAVPATISMFNDNSPFMFITGFALGTQVEQYETGSTCYASILYTKVILD